MSKKESCKTCKGYGYVYLGGVKDEHGNYTPNLELKTSCPDCNGLDESKGQNILPEDSMYELEKNLFFKLKEYLMKDMSKHLFQPNIDVKIKKLDPDAVIPLYANPGEDAGMDFTATSKKWDHENHIWSYGTGIAMQIPKGYVGLLFARSSIFKQKLDLSNAVGVIDSGYRGEVMFKYRHTHDIEDIKQTYQVGDRIGQMIILPYPIVKLLVVDKLDDSTRGEGGYGSTGK